jgi:CTP:molybdopterin cytidylyltransferase MocA
MGRSKALLDAGGLTFLARVLDCFGKGGAAPTLVVVGDALGPEAEEASRRGGIVVRNPDPTPGPISSLQAGIRALPGDVHGVFYCPVDHPLFLPSTVRTMARVFRETGAPVVSPVYQGRRGHPVLFHRTLFPELLEEDLPQGARTVLGRYLRDRRDVPVEDAGVLIDIDTPEEYLRHFP